MNINKTLVVGSSWIGDMIMSQSLFMLLKQKNPNMQIDVLAPAWSRGVLERMPEINRIIPMPFDHGELKLKEQFQLAKNLKPEAYQQAIILRRSLKSYLIPYFASIPKRIGYAGFGRRLLSTETRTWDKDNFPRMIEKLAMFAIEKDERLPKILPFPKLEIQKNQILQTLTKHNIMPPEKPCLIVCPGAEYGPAKRWPVDYFAQVAHQKIQEGWEVWLLGSAKEAELGVYIQTKTQQKCRDFIGKTTLNEAIDLMSLGKMVLCNDSGLMHIAAALGKKLVAVFGSTDPSYTPPLSNHAKILRLDLPCSPCFQRTCPLEHTQCLRQLSVETVLNALAEGN